MSVPRPLIAEQSRIAGVLDTVDESIAKTQAVIAKLRQVRAGLLQDLLTRGLDKNGQLRCPIAHPDQFQPSPIGQIPKPWEVKALGSCVSSEITYGIVQAGPHIEHGVPYIRTGDMNGDCLVADQMLRTSPEIAAQFRRSRVQTGEIVCAIRATVGKVLPVPAELDGANLTQGTAKISPGERIGSEFLFYAFNSKYCQIHIDRVAKGVTFREITLDALRRVPLIVPPKKQQEEIVAYLKGELSTFDVLLAESQRVIALLQERRTALISAAVTGQIDVRQQNRN